MLRPTNNRAKILVIIPAHNEENNIERVIAEIRSASPDLDLLVVDDASTDGTRRIARQCGVEVATLPFNLGIGGAVQTGFKVARRLGYNIAIQVDGDGQHDPSCIQQLIEPLIRNEADIAIGSRHLYNGNAKPSLARNVGIRFFSWLTSRATSQEVTDCSSGFRALNKRAFGLFADDYPIDFPDAEALIAAHRAGLRIREVGARFRERARGRSSLRSWRMLYYPFKETLSIVIMMTRSQRPAQ